MTRWLQKPKEKLSWKNCSWTDQYLLFLFLLLEVGWARCCGVRASHTGEQCISWLAWVTVDSVCRKTGLYMKPALLCILAVFMKWCPCAGPSLDCFEENCEPGNSGIWALANSVQMQGAGTSKAGNWPACSPVSFPSRFSLPCCFSGSEADFSSSSSTGSISAPEVHMSTAGSKRSSSSRK